MLLKIADIIDANKEHLAMVETLDNGKPYTGNHECGRSLCRRITSATLPGGAR